MVGAAKANSLAYVRSLFDPQNVIDIRIPEPVCVPTATASVRGLVELTPVTGTASKMWGAVFSPDLVYHVAQPATMVSANDFSNLTWSAFAASDSLSSFSSTDVAAYRIVSMGIEIEDFGKWRDRGVALIVGQQPSVAYSTAAHTVNPVLVDPIGATMKTNRYTIIDSDHLGPDGEYSMSFQPVTLYPSFIARGTSSEYSAAAWKHGSHTVEIFDNALTLFAYTTDITVSDVFRVRTTINVEYIPTQAGQVRVSTRFADGDPKDVADAFVRIYDYVDRNGLSDRLRNGTFADFQKLLKMGSKAFPRAQRTFDGAMGAMFGGPASMAEVSRHYGDTETPYSSYSTSTGAESKHEKVSDFYTYLMKDLHGSIWAIATPGDYQRGEDEFDDQGYLLSLDLKMYKFKGHVIYATVAAARQLAARYGRREVYLMPEDAPIHETGNRPSTVSLQYDELKPNDDLSGSVLYGPGGIHPHSTGEKPASSSTSTSDPSETLAAPRRRKT